LRFFKSLRFFEKNSVTIYTSRNFWNLQIFNWYISNPYEVLTGISSYFIIWLGDNKYDKMCIEYSFLGTCRSGKEIEILLPLTASVIATLLARFFTTLSRWERHFRKRSSKWYLNFAQFFFRIFELCAIFLLNFWISRNFSFTFFNFTQYIFFSFLNFAQFFFRIF